MKAIIRIDNILETAEDRKASGVSSFALSQLTQNFVGPASLVVREDVDLPLYVTLSHRPPELIEGVRTVHAVFWPTDSQEPIATFMEEEDARAWATEKFKDKYRLEEIDSTDHETVIPNVVVMMWRGDSIYFLKMKSTGKWILPSTVLGVGENINSAASRAMRDATGIEIVTFSIPTLAPYVNIYFNHRHYLALILKCTLPDGAEVSLDDDYTSAEWFDAKEPPENTFGFVTGILAVLKSLTQSPS